MPTNLTASDNYDTSEDRSPDAEPTNPVNGAGGGVMDVWTSTRRNKLTTLITGQSFTNDSQFPLPPGIIDGSADPYDIGFQNNNGERRNGPGADGQVFDLDDTPLLGTARLDQDGETTHEVSTSGVFILAGDPPDAVTAGPDGDGVPTLDVRFVPTVDAISFVSEDTTWLEETLSNVTYADVQGTVTDVDGNPVEGVSIDGEGASTSTDANGDYSLLGPGGSTATLSSLDGSAEKDASLNEGQTTTVDWQFAGVDILVLLPNNDPVEGVQVELSHTAQVKQTDKAGHARFVQVPVNTAGTFTIATDEQRDLDSDGEGALSNRTVTAGVAWSGRIINTASGDAVRGVDVKVVGDRTSRFFSRRDGSYDIPAFESGNLILLVADDDRRYITSRVIKDVADGSIESDDFDLVERVNQSNA